MDQNTSAVSNEAQLMEELKKLEQSARQYQQEVSQSEASQMFSCRPLPPSSVSAQLGSPIQLQSSCYWIISSYCQ